MHPAINISEGPGISGFIASLYSTKHCGKGLIVFSKSLCSADGPDSSTSLLSEH